MFNVSWRFKLAQCKHNTNTLPIRSLVVVYALTLAIITSTFCIQTTRKYNYRECAAEAATVCYAMRFVGRNMHFLLVYILRLSVGTHTQTHTNSDASELEHNHLCSISVPSLVGESGLANQPNL